MAKTRIQLEVERPMADFLERFRVATGATSQKELFNNAITIFRWAAQQVAAGKVIAAVDEERETYKELQMPALLAAGQYARAHPGALDVVHTGAAKAGAGALPLR